MLPEQLSKNQEAALGHLLAVKVMGWQVKPYLDHRYNEDIYSYFDQSGEETEYFVYKFPSRWPKLLFWNPFEDANQALMVLRKGFEIEGKDLWGPDCFGDWIDGPTNWMRSLIDWAIDTEVITPTELEEVMNDA